MLQYGSVVFKNIEQIKEKVDETKNNEFYKLEFIAIKEKLFKIAELVKL